MCCVSNANATWRLKEYDDDDDDNSKGSKKKAILVLCQARPFELLSLFVNDAMIFNSFATMLCPIKNLDRMSYCMYFSVCYFCTHKRYFVKCNAKFYLLLLLFFSCPLSLSRLIFFPFLIRLAYFSLQQQVIISSSHCE